ncbi:hypothetical protein T4E_5725 [Trichinella pseudospiralis]|uniref:Uncharacterized protein n=1 Tax=Trichinella pseudospiralis TaxID=6337 RepID=A0A0V0Y354_TRIPS|nr:hypothetical protein T4E_5725 [Trichinella pseudospiralis]
MLVTGVTDRIAQGSTGVGFAQQVEVISFFLCKDFWTDRQLDSDGANDGVIHAKRPTKLEEKLFRNAIPGMKS